VKLTRGQMPNDSDNVQAKLFPATAMTRVAQGACLSTSPPSQTCTCTRIHMDYAARARRLTRPARRASALTAHYVAWCACAKSTVKWNIGWSLAAAVFSSVDTVSALREPSGILGASPTILPQL
jgi:hypothetical protein